MLICITNKLHHTSPLLNSQASSPWPIHTFRITWLLNNRKEVKGWLDRIGMTCVQLCQEAAIQHPPGLLLPADCYRRVWLMDSCMPSKFWVMWEEVYLSVTPGTESVARPISGLFCRAAKSQIFNSWTKRSSLSLFLLLLTSDS